MTGLPLMMGVDRTPHDVFVQNAGTGWQLPAADFRRLFGERRSLQHQVLLYAQMLSLQTDYTAVSNARNTIDERLARWLLMAQDRLHSDRLVLTQEFLAQMLGVRRPGVTVAMNLLEKAEVVASKRGVISVLSRKRLEKAANGAYGIPEAEYRRVIG
jgi:CRP-like cAMP-binding protein